jgi:hypothetical protein
VPWWVGLLFVLFLVVLMIRLIAPFLDHKNDRE